MKRTAFRSQRGQTVVMFTIGAVTMFGMLGLVVDIGFAYYRKNVAQAAAQSAAMAAVKAAMAQSGGSSISCGSNSVSCYATETACPGMVSGNGADNMEKGCLYAAANGFTTAGRQWVKMQSGSGTVNGVNVSYYVIAKAGESLPQLYSAVLGQQNAMVVARSIVGYIAPSTLAGCIFVLNPTAVSLSMNGNTSLQTGCGLYVNSNNPGAITMSGSNATISATGGAKVNVTGNVNYGSNPGAISPSPIVGAPSQGDPMAGLDPPVDDTCQSGVNVHNNQTVNLSPGTYCGDISVTGTLNLAPGTYIIKGSNSGGLSVSGQGTLNGTGVTIYYETGSAKFAGGSTVNLSAPTSGTYQGVLMFQARGNTETANLVGGSSQITNGVLYFPNATVNYKGGSTGTTQNTTIVVDTLNLVGNSSITAAASSPYLSTISGMVILE